MPRSSLLQGTPISMISQRIGNKNRNMRRKPPRVAGPAITSGVVARRGASCADRPPSRMGRGFSLRLGRLGRRFQILRVVVGLGNFRVGSDDCALMFVQARCVGVERNDFTEMLQLGDELQVGISRCGLDDDDNMIGAGVLSLDVQRRGLAPSALLGRIPLPAARLGQIVESDSVALGAPAQLSGSEQPYDVRQENAAFENDAFV